MNDRNVVFLEFKIRVVIIWKNCETRIVEAATDEDYIK